MFDENRVYPWGHQRRFNDFSTSIRKKYSYRVQKVSIDAGFSCPNRDGSKGIGGCTFCNNSTFKPTYCNLEISIKKQVEKGIEFFQKRYKTMRYHAYFQAYTNTYAPLDILIKLYEEALEHPLVDGLVIATRPDCLPDDLLDYLHEKSEASYVMVELGIESCSNTTLEFINRGHTFEDSKIAFKNLSERNIHNCAHMIIGLPGDKREMILEQSRILSELPIENLKLHQLQIHKNTKMEHQFEDMPELFDLFDTVEDYIELVINYLELLNPSIVLERFVSQSPKDLLIAPKWGLKNFEFVAKLEKRMNEIDTWQGRLYRQ